MSKDSQTKRKKKGMHNGGEEVAEEDDVERLADGQAVMLSARSTKG